MARLAFFDQNQNWTSAELVAVYDESLHQRVQDRFSQFKKMFFEITEFDELRLDDSLWAQWQKKRVGSEPFDRQQFLKRVIFEFLSICHISRVFQNSTFPQGSVILRSVTLCVIIFFGVMNYGNDPHVPSG